MSTSFVQHGLTPCGMPRDQHPPFSLQGVRDYFSKLPMVDNPEIFGMHENANVTFNTNESISLMQTVRAIVVGTQGKPNPATGFISIKEATSADAVCPAQMWIFIRVIHEVLCSPSKHEICAKGKLCNDPRYLHQKMFSKVVLPGLPCRYCLFNRGRAALVVVGQTTTL